jgi:hypothetical protein
MIGYASPSDLAIWLVPAFFYFIDNLVLLDWHEFLIVEGRGAGCAFRFQRLPFEMRGRGLYIGPLFRPQALAIKAGWLAADASPGHGCALARRYAGAWRNRFAMLKFVSIFAFIYLFVAAPILTALFGIYRALIWAIFVHVVTLSSTFLLCWPLLKKTLPRRSTIIAQYFELLVCPGYFPNIARRLTLKYARLPVDGVLFLRSTGNIESFERLHALVLARLTDLEEEHAADAVTLRRISDYRRELAQ